VPREYLPQIMQEVREKIRQELERPILVGYRWAALVLGIYLVALIPLYFLNEPPPQAALQSLATLGAAALLFLCHWLLRGGRVSSSGSQWIVATGVGAILAQVLLHMSLRGSMLLTTDVMLILVGSALIFRDSRWFLVSLGVTQLAWASVVFFNALIGDWIHWSVGMITASVVALVIHFHLRRVYRTQEELRFQDHLREREKEQLIAWLSESLDNIKTLKGLIPICARCKKVRDDDGFWQQVEHYVKARSEVEFTHGICPDCGKEMMAELKDRPIP